MRERVSDGTTRAGPHREAFGKADGLWKSEEVKWRCRSVTCLHCILAHPEHVWREGPEQLRQPSTARATGAEPPHVAHVLRAARGVCVCVCERVCTRAETWGKGAQGKEREGGGVRRDKRERDMRGGDFMRKEDKLRMTD